MKQIILSFIALTMTFCISAQELRCRVQVNSSLIQGTNKQIFTTLEKELNELMNNRKWSNATYTSNERIECSLVITIKNYSGGDSFNGELQVQARRPVYNSTYFTTLFNFRDQNFNFNYIESQPLETNERQTSNNLIAMLYFYGYIILGYDADSFSRLGGSPFFHRAEEIANAMQSSSETGWKAFESEHNRYALINGILDEKLRPVRELYYDYHRLGLDIMAENADNGRAKIASSLMVLRQANNDRLYNIAITSFLDTKIDEIADIFSNGQPKEKSDVYALLLDVAPSMQKRFEKIQNGK
ncbi:DUF4835 family protein [Paludibacter sp.]|uniref:type IX secretion system protein PorD n=1 Tax=Paludibacter sp. TaxID=1898105 RepID=UPI001352FE41|nr:DUF4835 family protein [Paludibacter sp.]MTK52189.1 DUF4835 family protein [Paludibacter sp.]